MKEVENKCVVCDGIIKVPYGYDTGIHRCKKCLVSNRGKEIKAAIGSSLLGFIILIVTFAIVFC